MKEQLYAINENTLLLNHAEQGSCVVCYTGNGQEEQWKEVKVNGRVGKWQGVNDGGVLLEGTRFVRVVAMVNYNSGYPLY